MNPNQQKSDMTTTPMSQRHSSRWHLIPRLALGLPLLATAAFAQSETTDEVYVMDPFTITAEQDTGYAASNSIAGTRTNTPIREIPMNIQVFTKDLSDDLMMGSQLEMTRYNSALINGGADVHSSNDIQQAHQQFIFRGFRQNWGLRDGVRTYDPIDSQGLARVEVVKGPAAALYGVTYPGGVINSVTKQVDFFNSFTEIRLTGASEGEWRATIDANAVNDSKVGKVGVRFNGAKTESRDYRDHSKGKVDYSLVNVGWIPLEGTKIQFTAERGYREKPNGLGFFTIGGTGDGAEVPLQIHHPEIPWEWNWAVDNMRSSEVDYYRADITQSVGDNFSLTAYYQYLKRTNVDSDGWDANGNTGAAAGWDLGFSASRGGNATGWLNPNTPQERIALQYHYRHWENANNALGATAVYRLDLGAINNTFTAGAHTWNEKFNSKKATQPGDSPNLIYFPVQAGIDLRLPAGPPADYFWDRPGNERENSANTYYFVTWQMSALDNRLRTNVGVNRTDLNLKLLNKTGEDPNSYWEKVNETKEDQWSPMIGGMFDITEDISLFALYSTSLFPNTDKNDFMEQMPPIEGKSYEVGAKIELMEGKLSGTLSYYIIEQSGGTQTDPNAENLDTRMWDSMTPEQRELEFPGQSREQLAGDYVPGGTQEAKGMEADLVFTPNANWQMVLSLAHTDQETTEAIDSSLEGLSVEGLIENQIAFLTKYSFTEGAAEGLSLGVGGKWADEKLIGYYKGIARYNPSTFYLEAFATYRFDLMGLDAMVQFNAKNITSQDDFVGWVDTGSASVISTERYKVPTEPRLSLTFGVDF